jgi:hypothetical protein
MTRYTHKRILYAFFVFACIAALYAFSGGVAQATSKTWNKLETGYMCAPPDADDKDHNWNGCYAGYAHEGNINVGIIGNPNIGITYDTRVIDAKTGAVINSGTEVPKGTVLEYEFRPHVSDHISWAATGYFYDTPYGDWVAGAGLPAGNLCVEKNYVKGGLGDSGDHAIWASLSVDPPVKTLSVSNASCVDISTAGRVASRCTLSSAGTVKASFVFKSTTGQYYIIRHTIQHSHA